MTSSKPLRRVVSRLTERIGAGMTELFVVAIVVVNGVVIIFKSRLIAVLFFESFFKGTDHMLSNIADRESIAIWIKVVKLLKLHLCSAYNLSQLSDSKIIRGSSA